MKFANVSFSGMNAEGRRKSTTIKSITARDAYDAGDKIKSRFASFDRNVIIKFGNPTKISTRVARIALNAGPEEI